MAIMTRAAATPTKGRRAAKSIDAELKQKVSSGSEEPGGAGKKSRKDKSKVPSCESFVPTLPSINVLPPAVTERAHVERLRRGFAAGAVVAVAAVGAAFTLQAGAISSANDDLAQEEARSGQLTSQVAALRPVETYYSTVQADVATIQQTMSHEVLLSDVVDRLYATAPSGVDLGTVSVVVDTSPAAPAPVPGAPAPAVPVAPTTSAACPSPDPYVAPGATAGCVTITGNAVSRSALGDWEAQIGKTDLFADLFIASTDAAAEAGPNAITFSASVSVTAAAYADRYADPAFVEGTSK